MLTRREFLKSSLAAGAGLVVGSYLSSAFASWMVQPKELVGDALAFALESDPWSGPFGFVTFRLHEGFYNGELVYFIRTDASEKTFAERTGTVFVPRLNQALRRGESGERAVGELYLFEGGVSDQRPVLSSVPGQPDYSPLWQVHFVTGGAQPEPLTSVEAIEAARLAREVEVRASNVVVKWPGGEMPHDTELERYLGEGQLIGPVDTQSLQVTFKLQRCFPDMRYLVTDASMEGAARAMHIAYSPKTALLHRANRAMARVFVFGNGVEGGGPMGFQSSIMAPLVGKTTWSPLWNHFTMLWQDPSIAVLLTSEEDLRGREEVGEIQRFLGTPDTHPQGFVVNCPVPVLA